MHSVVRPIADARICRDYGDCQPGSRFAAEKRLKGLLFHASSVLAAFAARLALQCDFANHNPLVHGLTHVIDG